MPAPAPHYVVGSGYQAGDVWFYPREDFQYVATGLAVVQPERQGLTADGEAIDPSALTAAHQTLQLPCVARVTNLDTGVQLSVRVNDRGPETPKRLVGLSRRAGELLGLLPGATAPVRVEVDGGLSLALRKQVAGDPRIAITAAPRGTVTSEMLTPPSGTSQSPRRRSAGASPADSEAGAGTNTHVPERLPEIVYQVPIVPGALRIDAGAFGRAVYARQVATRLGMIGAQVERVGQGRSEQYAVKAGPFATTGTADAALDQALRAGVTDARIVVE